jgi:predicted aspartyl protease/transposase InsO family protein
VDLKDLDLSLLMGGPPLLVPAALTMGGIGAKLKALIDTGANGYLFLDRPFALRLAKSLDVKVEPLPFSVPIKGFNEQITSKANQFIRLHLSIDGRRISNCPFVLLPLGQQDMIIGRKWLKHFRIMVDSSKGRLIWPANLPAVPNFQRLLLSSSKEYFPILLNAQEDADRRDRLIEQEDRLMKRSEVISEFTPIRDASPPQLSTPILTRSPSVPIRSPIDFSFSISEISANALHHEMQQPDSEFFITSIYELNRILDDHLNQERDDVPMDDDETRLLIQERLPSEYAQYADVFSKAMSNQLPPHRSYDHKIILNEKLPNAFSPLYKQSTAELEATREYIMDNLNKGFITNSSSPFASPILFVKKSDSNKLRFCIDFRKLNALTRKDAYPIPRIDELLARIGKAVIFTKLDIRQAFNRIRMDPESEEMTTFRTRYGMYKCKVLPFGLCNGPATYQRYMNDVLMDYLDHFCTAYLDDILIYSESKGIHEEHVKKVLLRLREAGLQADILKTEFHVTRVKFLGYIVTTKGLETDPNKTEVLRNWVKPTTITGVKSFLGFCGFYRQFIKDFGKIALPLTKITRPTVPFEWNPDCDIAFEVLKQSLLKIQSLYHFDSDLDTKVETDSSDGVVAGVLSQKHGDNWYPVGFYSHVLSGHEPNWEIHDKELYAIVEAFKRWRAELISVQSRIEVYSDHKSLEYFMSTKILTAKQVRWMEFLSDFNFRIAYVTGKSNTKADLLTRREQDIKTQNLVKQDSRSRVLLGPQRLDPRINAELGEAYAQINRLDSVAISILHPLKESDSELTRTLLQDNRDSFAEERKQLPADYTLSDGLLLYKTRLCVRRHSELCTSLIREVHNQVSTAHPSARKTYQLLAPSYYWPGMSTDCSTYVSNCRECRYSHPRQSKQQGFLHPLPIPEYPMQHLCMDFKSFPPDKHGYDSILVFIDRLSKTSVSIPCHKDIDAKGLARLFIEWIYRFGHCPESITSDRGPQFISAFWHEFCRIIGVKLQLSTAYHKQTDGQTEIMNRYIDQRLRPFVNHYQNNWSELIPIMDHVQATVPHSSIGMAPYRLKFGHDPRTSWNWDTPAPAQPRERLSQQEAVSMAKRMHNAQQIAKENMKISQERMSAAANQHRRAIDWKVGDKVYLSTSNLRSDRPSKKLSAQWTGPFPIIEQVGHSYKLKLPNGSTIHDVFAPDVLSKDPNNPLPGQQPPEPPPDVIEGEREWEVQQILGSRLFKRQLQYRVKWVGYDDDPAWYPAGNFVNSNDKVKEFHEENPTAPKAIGSESEQ